MKLVPLLLLLALCCFGQATNPAVNVRAWGDNFFGQCDVPADLTNAVAIAAGNSFGLALRSDGTLVSWGTAGEIPPGLSNVVAINVSSCCDVVHSMALRADDTVVAWGNSNGQGQNTVPPTCTNITTFAAGNEFGLALRADGVVLAWGDNMFGECNVPADLTNAVQLATGKYNCAAVRANGVVTTWGLYPPPFPAVITNYVRVAIGNGFGVALKADGTVSAWGGNSSGQCNVPAGLSNVVAIATGHDHSMALCADGTMRAWGYNAWGQCNVPLDLARVKAVAGSCRHTLALVEPAEPGARPTILTRSTSRTTAVGSTVKFSVGAVGFPPLLYQWYAGTNVIADATNRVLVLTNVQSWQSGEYTVVVANGSGGTTSQPNVLQILPALNIHMVPAISLFGDVGQEYRLDYVNAIGPTTDWVALATIGITNTGQLYLDVSAIGQPQRFYRLVQVP